MKEVPLPASVRGWLSLSTEDADALPLRSVNGVDQADLLDDYTAGHKTDIFFIDKTLFLDGDDPECKELP